MEYSIQFIFDLCLATNSESYGIKDVIVIIAPIRVMMIVLAIINDGNCL